ncbi:MAG TPA: hypothetical protein ENG11_02100 [candidate division Zixibacteria bacterium]|nr:MAG: hypothetical protein DRO01_07915 [Candidatus Korarchaeota archaeon]HDG67922.1 hypothetical protein [candidate division Zixibacteria bacterium]
MKTKRIILLLILVVLVAAIVAGATVYFSNKSGRHKLKKIESELAKNIVPAREKLIKMCPSGYDTKKLERAFDRYIEYARRGQVKINYVKQNLVPYLISAVEDGKLSSREADSLAVLFKNAARASK